jgi:hypothetical protein
MRLCPCKTAREQYNAGDAELKRKKFRVNTPGNAADHRPNKSTSAVIFDTNIAIRMCFNASELTVVTRSKSDKPVVVGAD